MRYALIGQLRNQHPITHLYALLDVAKSSYQAWSADKVASPRKRDALRLLLAIKAAP